MGLGTMRHDWTGLSRPAATARPLVYGLFWLEMLSPAQPCYSLTLLTHSPDPSFVQKCSMQRDFTTMLFLHVVERAHRYCIAQRKEGRPLFALSLSRLQPMHVLDSFS